jgi:hypothetical protein
VPVRVLEPIGGEVFTTLPTGTGTEGTPSGATTTSNPAASRRDCAICNDRPLTWGTAA